MAIIHINKETLVKKWKEFYGEDFSKEYKGLSDSITDEVIIEKEGIIIFRGNQEELTQFIIDSMNIANTIAIDIEAGWIEDDEFVNMDFNSYKEFADNYATEYEKNSYTTINHKGHLLDLEFEKYENGRTAISLSFNGEPYMTASVNLPEYELAENEVFIKNYSENEGILMTLILAGIISPNYKSFVYNHVEIQKCELLIKSENIK